MKLIRTEDAAGQVLCHDITQIIPGEFKGARFRKGHIIQPEDIPVLLSIGKENLYVWEKKPGILHEDEAAALLYKAAAGKNIHGTEPKEGKIELIADCDGLLKINREALLAVNRTPQMMIATIHGDLPVKKGQKLAGTRIIPLVIEQEKMDAMQAAAGSEPILNVLPMQAKKFAVITTGSEVFKGPRFRKGHIVQPEDIPVLLSIGKENLYVWEKRPDILHEDEAAALLYKAAAGKNIHGTEPKEGKIELIADCDGLLKIDRAALLAVNRTPQMMIATIHGDMPVKKGQKLAGTRIIPLVIEQEKMDAMQAAAGPEPILNVLPFRAKKFAVIPTGSEVFKGRIEDKFTPILQNKLAEYGCEMTFRKVCDDDPAGITAAILEAKDAGCELIFTTGGMSVDPDDRTPLAIKNTGADIISYGAPVLPGAMFLVSYLDGVPVCGLPGCVMYAKRTIFDLLLPRLLADAPITAEDIARLGEGGLCLGCAECHWPNCGFGHC